MYTEELRVNVCRSFWLKTVDYGDLDLSCTPLCGGILGSIWPRNALAFLLRSWRTLIRETDVWATLPQLSSTDMCEKMMDGAMANIAENNFICPQMAIGFTAVKQKHTHFSTFIWLTILCKASSKYIDTNQNCKSHASSSASLNKLNCLKWTCKKQ